MRLSPPFHPSVCSQRVWRDYGPVNIFFSHSRWRVRLTLLPLTATFNFLTSQHISFFPGVRVRELLWRLHRGSGPPAHAHRSRSAGSSPLTCFAATGSVLVGRLIKYASWNVLSPLPPPPCKNTQLRSKQGARYCHVTWEQNWIRWIVFVFARVQRGLLASSSAYPGNSDITPLTLVRGDEADHRRFLVLLMVRKCFP